MPNYKLEYIWLDGYQPDPLLRSKTKILSMKSYGGQLEKLPEWSFDGSSTLQAEGHSSDCMLKPVRVYPDRSREYGYFVLCEVFNADGTPHRTNTRAPLREYPGYWFGFEQEYVLMLNGKPLGFPEDGYPPPQGPYYCGVGNGRVDGRTIVESHMDACLDAGISITGINAEVMLGQWEYQCFGKGARKASDDLIMSRYLLYRVAETYGVDVELHPKPVKGDWNGSGMHTNFSNSAMRKKGGKELFLEICEAFRPTHSAHIAVYGAYNDQRLTGLHETQSIIKFSYGVSDRGASIRIPLNVERNWKGYLEDRRPASNADPYKVTHRIMKTVEEGMERFRKVKGKKNGAKKKNTKKNKSKKKGVSQANKSDVKKPAPAPVKTPDNLKKIEGIGPKIEYLLLTAGLTSYGKLAAASPDKLRQILSEGGHQFKRHDPSTWPQQAKYAKAKDWNGLKAFQDQLNSGQIPDK